jgi:hypothetical protein
MRSAYLNRNVYDLEIYDKIAEFVKSTYCSTSITHVRRSVRKTLYLIPSVIEPEQSGNVWPTVQLHSLPEH